MKSAKNYYNLGNNGMTKVCLAK